MRHAPREGKAGPARCGTRRRAPAALCAGAALLLACGGASRSGSDGAAAPTEVIPISGAELRRLAHEPGPRAVLVNVWATWCIPCRKEFPHLVRLHRQYAARGLRVILVSGDFDSERAEVLKFLREQGVDFPSYIKTGKDMEFIEAFEPRWSGALPATFIYDSTRALRHSWEHEASYDTFESRVLEVMGDSAGKPAQEGQT